MSFFEIVLEKRIIEGDTNFWLEVIKQLISGIAIGVTLALIGYYIWKRQNLYSKKFEVYINIISSLNEINRKAIGSIVHRDITKLKVFFESNQIFFQELQKNKQLFVAFFGSRFNKNIEYFIDIIANIETVKNTYADSNGSYTQQFKPEEYTTEILNMHGQQVIDKMNDYLEDLKSVSKSMKRYVI